MGMAARPVRTSWLGSFHPAFKAPPMGARADPSIAGLDFGACPPPKISTTGAILILIIEVIAAIIIALFVAYNFFHYELFLLVTQPKDASKIGHELNQFEQRQLVEWTPQPSDFLKHDDEKRSYDDRRVEHHPTTEVDADPRA
jgi:hypothetical protein